MKMNITVMKILISMKEKLEEMDMMTTLGEMIQSYLITTGSNNISDPVFLYKF